MTKPLTRASLNIAALRLKAWRTTAMGLTCAAMLAATPALACRPAPLDDRYWQERWTESSSVSLGRVVRVTPYTAAELDRLNRRREFMLLQRGAGLAEIELVRELRGAAPERIRVEYQTQPPCWYAWSPDVDDIVMVFTGPRPEAWPRDRITLPRLRAFFGETQ